MMLIRMILMILRVKQTLMGSESEGANIDTEVRVLTLIRLVRVLTMTMIQRARVLVPLVMQRARVLFHLVIQRARTRFK